MFNYIYDYFLAAMKLRRDKPDVVRGFKAPARNFFGWLGFTASLIAFLIGFVEPTGNAYSAIHPQLDFNNREL